MTRNALITGTSSGIGHALAKSFLDQGMRVLGLSRRESADLQASSAFKFSLADLRNLEAIPAALRNLLSEVKHLELVILNAGVLGRLGDMGEIPVREMQGVMDVNLWANKVLLDSIFEMGITVQQVVAMSSGAATAPNRGWNAYAISKAALNMLVGLYASERPETHFCALAPGIVDTAMQEAIHALPQDERFPSLDMLRSAKGSPMMPKPRDAAARLVEGISKATKYPSGSFLDINSLVKRSWTA